MGVPTEPMVMVDPNDPHIAADAEHIRRGRVSKGTFIRWVSPKGDRHRRPVHSEEKKKHGFRGAV
eukprot:NODE_9269_length_376_cov_10.446483_g8368_i0.p2 GENE.NODE_9269_length_376_cov_10.446483_g8368_i0~~NODE_9269_length_376_cov_10.446483_g8368_i0.p2  ORF type:complete len:65 (-),score=13.98 NODE_9269_length_376_cov_10.446483_g8368_i0:153-347(-)